MSETIHILGRNHVFSCSENSLKKLIIPDKCEDRQ